MRRPRKEKAKKLERLKPCHLNLIAMKIVNVIVKENIMIMMIMMITMITMIMMIIIINDHGQKFCSPETGSPAAWIQFSLHPDDNDHDYDNSAQQMILYGPPSLSHC